MLKKTSACPERRAPGTPSRRSGRSSRVTDRLIRPLLASDWESVRRIYQEGIATGNATFETEAPEWERWDVAHRKDSRFVACVGESVVGWAALSRVSARKVYAGVGEVTVYVAEAARGSGT